MTPAELRAAMDDLPLISLQTMQRTLLTNIRRASSVGNDALTDDYFGQLGIVEAEALRRTSRLNDRAGQGWADSEDTRLRRLARAGETIECISSTLGRSTVAVSLRAERLGLRFGDDGRAVTGVTP